MDISEIPIPSAEAIAFICDCLKRGNSLAKILQKAIEVNDGKVAALLPRNIHNNKLVQFYYGGILAREEAMKYLALLLQSCFLKENDCCVFEDAMTLSSDYCFTKMNAQILTYQNEVMGLITKKSSIKQITNTINETQSTYLFIGAVTQLPSGIDSELQRQALNINQLESLADNTRMLIFGAYDMESYVIWRYK